MQYLYLSTVIGPPVPWSSALTIFPISVLSSDLKKYGNTYVRYKINDISHHEEEF